MGFLDNVAKKPSHREAASETADAGFHALLASGVLGRKQAGLCARHEPGVPPGSWGIVGGIRWTARKVPAERSWRRGEIMGRQRAKSTDPSWLTRFGSRSVDY